MVLESLFLNPIGILALLFSLILILFYLIRPKPRHEKIPSLVFFIKDIGKSNVNRLFRNFVRDILFFLQLLIFILLALAIARPFINLPRSITAEDSVMLIDVSASMHAGDRFDTAKEKALDNLASDNTIILIKSSPEIVGEHVSASRARSIIKKLKPLDTETDISSAIRTADAYTTSAGKLIIISDMIPSKGELEFESLINAVKSKGTFVKIYNVAENPSKNKGNIGIIDLKVAQPKSKLWIKNYNDHPEEATLKIGSEEQKILLGKLETKEVEFDVPNGLTEVEIENKDDFAADNKVYVSTPEKSKINILYISNRKNVKKENLATAFSLISKNFPIDITVDYSVPPKIPDLNHDVYIIDGVDTKLLLPGVIKHIKEKVEKGAGLIVFAQDDLFNIDLLGMLPVSYVDKGGLADVFPAVDNLLTQDINFGQCTSYTKTKAIEGTNVIAQTKDSPMITLSKLKKGIVVYYGLEEDSSSFSHDNSFVIFWKRLLDLMTDRPTLQNLNIRTGGVLQLPKKEIVSTPSGERITSILKTDNAGLYRFSDRIIAANLLSDLESNIYKKFLLKESKDLGSSEESKSPKDISSYFIIAGILLLLFELVYIKFRGDI